MSFRYFKSATLVSRHKDTNFFLFGNNLFAQFNKKVYFRFILPPEPPRIMNIINNIIQIMLQTPPLSH